jgi:hypothetical protein
MEELLAEPANLQGTLLHSENTARRKRKNTKLEAGLALPKLLAQPELALDTLQVVGHIRMDKRDMPTQ